MKSIELKIVHFFKHSRNIIQTYVSIDFGSELWVFETNYNGSNISTEAPSSLCWGFLFLVEHFYSRAEKMLYSTSGNMRTK